MFRFELKNSSCDIMLTELQKLELAKRVLLLFRLRSTSNWFFLLFIIILCKDLVGFYFSFIKIFLRAHCHLDFWCRCGKYPPVVKTAVPVDGRFEHIVMSCNATKDHAIISIQREAQLALDVSHLSCIFVSSHRTNSMVCWSGSIKSFFLFLKLLLIL